MPVLVAAERRATCDLALATHLVSEGAEGSAALVRGERLERGADYLGLGVAEDALSGDVPGEDPATLVARVDRDGGRGEDRPKE